MEELSHGAPTMRCLPALSILFFIPSWAFAHNVGVDCKLNGDKVEVEAFYDDDTAAAKAKVRVENAKEEVIASGVTDAKGKWSFAAPPPGKYVVFLDAGAGHRAQKELDLEETIRVGPTRDDFTRTPWRKIAIGLITIGGLGGAFLLASLLRKNGKV